jgi:Uncharacterized protein conserved in bacteria (DUF2237)
MSCLQGTILRRSGALFGRAASASNPTSRQRHSIITAMASGNSTGQTKNVLGGELQCCCKDPVTGFQRDGYCKVVSGDAGVHAVCAQVWIHAPSEFLCSPPARRSKHPVYTVLYRASLLSLLCELSVERGTSNNAALTGYSNSSCV